MIGQLLTLNVHRQSSIYPEFKSKRTDITYN